MSNAVVESPAPSLPLKKDDSILPPEADSSENEVIPGIRFVDYVDESQLDQVMSLVGRDLSEPYSSKYLSVVSYWLVCLYYVLASSLLELQTARGVCGVLFLRFGLMLPLFNILLSSFYYFSLYVPLLSAALPASLSVSGSRGLGRAHWLRGGQGGRRRIFRGWRDGKVSDGLRGNAGRDRSVPPSRYWQGLGGTHSQAHEEYGVHVGYFGDGGNQRDGAATVSEYIWFHSRRAIGSVLFELE
jgi:hypothetical protein